MSMLLCGGRTQGAPVQIYTLSPQGLALCCQPLPQSLAFCGLCDLGFACGFVLS